MPVDPEILRLARQMRTSKRPRANHPKGMSKTERMRAEASAAVSDAWAVTGLAIPYVPIETLAVKVADAPEVHVRIHRPRDTSDALPVLITFYGGAFRQGSNDFEYNKWAHARRSLDADIVVIAVDYAQAPEHRFPVAIRQGLAVLDWVFEQGPRRGMDIDRVALGGQSSGGNIAASVAQWNADRAGHPIALKLLEVPILDLSGKSADFGALKPLGVPKWLIKRDFARTVRNYLGKRVSADDPTASPLLRDDLSGLPPTAILAAEFDVLRGDAAAYHARLRAAGVPSSASIALGQTHDSAGMVGVLGAAYFWHQTAVGVLKTLHDNPRASALTEDAGSR